MDINSVIKNIDALFIAFRGFDRYDELGMVSEDFSQVRFGWGNWLEQPEPVLVKNESIWISPDNYTIDFNTGIVSLSNNLSAGDEIRANYTMRLFPITIYAEVLPMVVSMVNLRKPQTTMQLQDMPPNWIGPIILGLYVEMLKILIMKISLFKWNRLFQDPNSVMTQMRANLEDARAEFDTQLATTKRRGMIVPQGIASFNVGRNTGLWNVDEINFQNLVIAR